MELPHWTVHREADVVVRAAPLRHPVPCIGYVIDEPDAGGRMVRRTAFILD